MERGPREEKTNSCKHNVITTYYYCSKLKLKSVQISYSWISLKLSKHIQKIKEPVKKTIKVGPPNKLILD